MSRLDALVTALPKILPVVENIADDMFRDRVFDALVQAAIDDAATDNAANEPMPPGGYGQVLVADAAAPQGVSWSTPGEEATGTVYGNSVSVAPTGTPTQRTFTLQSPTDLSGPIVAPMVVDTGDQRITGTYEGDANGGTFTPNNLSPNPTGLYPPLVLHDAIGLSDAGLAQVRLETGAGSETLRPSDVPTYDAVSRDQRP